MTQPEAGPPRVNPYARTLLVVSILLMVGGLGYMIVSHLLPQGIDVIQSNEQLPLFLMGNGLGWNTLGLGVLTFCLWLAVQGIRHRP
jgi:hypothetical protein